MMRRRARGDARRLRLNPSTSPGFKLERLILARRPREVATAEEVDVNVEDGLARVRARVDDGAVATLGEPFLIGDAGGDAEQMAEQRLVRLRGVVEGFDVRARDDEDVRRSLRVDVAEGDGPPVFVDERGGNLARDDLAKETVLFRHNFGGETLKA